MLTNITTQIPFPVVLGRTIAALRRVRGHTQRDFAKAMGTAQGTIAWIESGRTAASAMQLWRIEQELIAAGVLVESGAIFAVASQVERELRRRGVEVVYIRHESPGDRAELERLDGVVEGVLKEWSLGKATAGP